MERRRVPSTLSGRVAAQLSWAFHVERDRERLLEGLREAGAVASTAQIEALLELARLLDRWADRINLTGHRGPEAIVARLVLDAVALLPRLTGVSSLADLGSGAGFPGLPLAILLPGCRVTLVEARERRHYFQRAAARGAGLDNVRIERGRAERLSPRPHQAVIAQAMGPPEMALRWMVPWAARGGRLLLPGGAEDWRPPPHPEVHWVACHRYAVPAGGPRRTLWEGRRIRGEGAVLDGDSDV